MILVFFIVTIALALLALLGCLWQRRKLVLTPQLPVFPSATAAPEGILYHVGGDAARQIFFKTETPDLSVIASDVAIAVDAQNRAHLNQFMTGQQQNLIVRRPPLPRGLETLEVMGEWFAGGRQQAILGWVPAALARETAQVCPTTKIYGLLDRIILFPQDPRGELRIALAVNKAAPEFHLQSCLTANPAESLDLLVPPPSAPPENGGTNQAFSETWDGIRPDGADTQARVIGEA